jgi:hypothetical protein
MDRASFIDFFDCMVADIMREKCSVAFCDWGIPAKWCRFCSKNKTSQDKIPKEVML